MFERVPDLEVVYVPAPPAVGPDDGVLLGAAWLAEQPGSPAVLLHAKKMYSNNRLLPELTRGATVIKPGDSAGWVGGPVLAPWPSERVLASLSDSLAPRVSSVCIVCWHDDPHLRAWLAAHEAVNLVDSAAPTERLVIDPVVEQAMRNLSMLVNHNNGLVGSYDKAYAVKTLQTLHAGGYELAVDALCAWSLANGFTAGEVERLRDYAVKVRAGHRFRLSYPAGPGEESLRRWVEAAANTGGHDG